MKGLLFDKITGFFIRDIETLPSEKQYKNQLLIAFIMILVVITFVLATLSLLGFYEDWAIIPIFLVCFISLIIVKFTGDVSKGFGLIFIIGTFLAAYNISLTGGIYSFNHKWFSMILIVMYFTIPQWLFRYTLGVVIIQFCLFFINIDGKFLEIGPREVVLIDNIAYFVIVYLFLAAVHKFNGLLYQRIENQTESLLVQKQNLEIKNQQLEDKTQQLLVSNQELERFAYIASHDLKTPLNNIISFSILLEKELKEVDNPKAHRYFGFIQDGSTKMNQLIKDVLEYSRLSAKEEDTEIVNLNELVAEIRTSIFEYLKEQNAVIKVDNLLPTIKSNHAKMYLLFKNLIENGIKYNESSSPTVKIYVRRKSEFYEFVFEDNGIGISKEFHNKVFNMFSRLHNSSEYEGTGLGLSLSKKIVDGLGGSIHVQNKSNAGSKFIVRLPQKHFINPVEKQKPSLLLTKLILEKGL